MQTLGKMIRAARELKNLSPGKVAKEAKISPAYLSKLERDEVTSPSPHRLHALSRVLGIDYAEMMRAVGYVVPGDERATRKPALAFDADDLTEDEVDDVRAYVSWYLRRSREQKAEG